MRASLISLILITALVPTALLAAGPPASASSHSFQDFCPSPLQLDDGGGMASYTLDPEGSEGPTYGDARDLFSSQDTKTPVGEVSCRYQEAGGESFLYEVRWTMNNFTQRQGDRGQHLASMSAACTLLPEAALGPEWISRDTFASASPSRHGWTEESNRTFREVGKQAIAKVEHEALACDQPFVPPCPAAYGDQARAFLLGPFDGSDPSTDEPVEGWYSSLCFFIAGDTTRLDQLEASFEGTFLGLSWAHVATSTPHPACGPDAETTIREQNDYGPEDTAEIYLSDDKAAGVAVILEARNGPSDDPDDEEFSVEDPAASRALAQDVLSTLEAVAVPCDASPGTVAPPPTLSFMREVAASSSGVPGGPASGGIGSADPSSGSDIDEPLTTPPAAPACLPVQGPPPDIGPDVSLITVDTYLGAGDDGWTWTAGSTDARTADLATVLKEGQAFATQPTSAATLTLHDAPDTSVPIADLQLSPGGAFCWTDATRAVDGQGGTVVSVTLALEQGLLYWRTSDQWPELANQGPGAWHIVRGSNTVVLQGTEAVIDATAGGDDVTVYMRDGQGEVRDTATGATRTTLSAGTTTEIRGDQADQRPMSDEDWQAATQSVETQASASDSGLPVTWLAIAGSVALLGGYWWYTGQQRGPGGPPPGYQQHPYQGPPPGYGLGHQSNQPPPKEPPKGHPPQEPPADEDPGQDGGP